MQENYKKLKLKIIISVIIVVGVIAGVRLYDDIKQHNDMISLKKEHIKNQFDILFKEKLHKVHNYLMARSNGLAHGVIKLLKNNQREELGKKVSRRFQRVITRDKLYLRRVNFFKPGVIAFYRVHSPKKYGDYKGDIKPMLKKADETQKTQSGFAYCATNKNQISYRVVTPLFDDKTYVGLLELVYDFIPELSKLNILLSKIYKIDNFSTNEILIKKDLLGLDDTSEYKVAIHDYVLIYKSSYKYLQQILKKYNSTTDTTITSQVRIGNKDFILSFDENLLKDFNGNSAGMIVSIFDITDDLKQYSNTIVRAVLKPFLILLVMIILFSYLFTRFIKSSIKDTLRRELVLNTQNSIVTVTNGKKMLETNKKFYDFFGYKNLKDFQKNHSCICDKFLQDEQNSYLEKVDEDNINWNKKILNNRGKQYKVLMQDIDGKNRIFTVNGDFVQNKDNSVEEVFVFSDVTDLVKQKDEAVKRERFIQEQSKHAQMGEMIGNIAHQWRQPLSIISTASTGALIQKECNLLTDDKFKKSMHDINKSAQFLSKTIETFTNYIKQEKELREVVLQDNINETIDILSASLKSYQIKLINNIDNCDSIKITMVIGELSQVIINLFNNAKDIMVEKELKDRWIKIALMKRDSTAIITIEDNGGGIPEDIIEKIFDPYFTTKHQSQGTGLGLHMCKDIIEKSLDGKIYTSNSEHGAKFFVELPLE